MRATADKRLSAPPPLPVMGRRTTVYGVVCAASLACYFNALSGDFVHDDIPAVTKNHDVVGTTPLLHVFANDFWGTPMSDPNSHKSYRPLTIITFRANYLLSGLQPVWFHGFNIILHAASCILFTRISLVVAGLNSRFATAAGLLFAVHPIHTEAVSGIVGRADVLACLLFLLSFLVYHDDSVGCTRKHRLLLSSLLAALSMLAKETGITVLLVNLIYDLYKCWPHVKRVIVDAKWNEDSIQFARRAAKIFMAMSVLLVFRLAILQGSLPKFSNQDNPTAFHSCPHVRLLTFCYLAAFNCWLLLCPSTLSHDWQMGSIPLVTSIADCRNIATCFFFGCCLLLAYRCLTDFEHQRHAPIVLGSLLLVIPFLPATNILVTVGFVVAERILYIPSLGSVLLTVYGAQILYNSYFCKQKMLFFLCFLLLIGGFSYKTTDRNRAWSSRESLVRSGIKALPHNAKMHYNFANYLRDINHIHLAISHYREALRLWPSYASAHNNLGTLMNSAAEAEAHFQSAISISPGHVNAHYNLGQVYRKMNRSVEAVTMLERCLRLDSAYTPAYLLLAKLHNPTTARRLLQHVTRLHTNSPDYLAYYAAWLYDNYYVSESLEYYMKALRLQHTHMTSLIGVAKCLRARGQIGRLHQILIRWHLIKRSHSSRGRLVYAGELYIRSWDLYKQGQSTSSQLPSATIASRGKHLSSGQYSKRRPKWWRHLGSCNLTENSCKHRQLHLIEQYQLTPMLRNNRKNFEDSSLSSTLCVENHDSELTARPGR